jgi:hypothetical protein
MTTQTPLPITHIFKEINKGKFKSTKHYELVEVSNGTSLLSEALNISKNQNCAQSMPEFWLKIKQGKNWSKFYITGLFKTDQRNIFKGDHNRRQNLLMFKYSEDTEILTVYYFRNYFTKDLSKILPLISR